MIQRVARTFCRTDDMNNRDDKTDNAAAPTLSIIPRELEGKKLFPNPKIKIWVLRFVIGKMQVA